MSQAQRGDAADDNRLRDFRPSKERWLQLATVLAGIFPSPQTSIEFLERDMRIPRRLIPDFSLNQSTEDYWLRILALFDAGDLADEPYERLFRAVQGRKVLHEPFELIFSDQPRTDPLAGRVILSRVNGCHVIVRTRDELVRERIRIWLESEDLEPEQMWSVHAMTSFEVSETSEEQLRALINGRYARLLVKVIPPGQPDELIDRLRVFDKDDRGLVVPDVPIQLTVAQLGAVAAQFHPAEASASTRTVGGKRRAETATHKGGGITQDVPMDGTLLQWGFADDDRVTIKSVKYQEIRVVFVGASPRWNGTKQLDDARVSHELEQINRMARQRHITLAGQFLNVTREHLGAIMQKEPDILHIVCQGKNGRLYWEDDAGDPDEVPARWLAERIAERAGRRLSGIVLSACDGESTGPLLTQAAREVIAHKSQVPNNLASDFTAKFYDELAMMPVLRAAAPLAARRADVYGSVLVFPPDKRGDSQRWQ